MRSVCRKTKNGCFGEHSASAPRLKTAGWWLITSWFLPGIPLIPAAGIEWLTPSAAESSSGLRPPGSSAEIASAFCHYPQIMGCLFSWRTAGAVVHTLLIETLTANILFLSTDSDSLIECTAPSSLPWKWSYCHWGLTLSTNDTWEHSILVWSADALTDVLECLAVKLHLLQILDYLNLKFSTFQDEALNIWLSCHCIALAVIMVYLMYLTKT